MRLLSGPFYKWVDVNGTKAIEIKYRRAGNGLNTTSCCIYLLQNNKEMVKLMLSFRDSEKYLWEQDFSHIIQTFKWLK